MKRRLKLKDLPIGKVGDQFVIPDMRWVPSKVIEKAQKAYSSSIARWLKKN